MSRKKNKNQHPQDSEPEKMEQQEVMDELREEPEAPEETSEPLAEVDADAPEEAEVESELPAQEEPPVQEPPADEPVVAACPVEPRGWWTPWRVALFATLVVMCFFTRFYDLGDKPIMHDESLFVYYTEYQLHREFNYTYLPILHGPAMLHLQNLVFHIFGVSDYTMRIGVGALGFFGFFFIWGMRRWLGEIGTWVALAFYTISPMMMFYQRFYRNDALFLFSTLWIVCSALWWWRTRRPGWAASLILAVVVLFCNKESSVFVYFTGVTFFAMLVVHDLAARLLNGKDPSPNEADTPPAETPRFPPVAVAGLVLIAFVILTLTQVLEGMHFDADVIQAIGHDFPLNKIRSIPMALSWMGQIEDKDGLLARPIFWRFFYIALIVGSFVGMWVVKQIVERRIGHRQFLTTFWSNINKSQFFIYGALLAGLAFYLAMFTTFFKHPDGPFNIYHRTLGYWVGQNEWHRIRGPFHMHGVNLLVYELPAVLTLFAGWMIAVKRIHWSRVTPVGILLAAIAMAGFHALVFHSSGASWNEGGIEQFVLVPYFKNLAMWGGILAIGLIAKPDLGKYLYPLAIIVFVLYSAVYFNSAEWSGYLTHNLNKIEKVEVDGRAGLQKIAGEPVKDAKDSLVSGQKHLDDLLSLTSGMHLFIIAFLVIVGTVLTWHAIDKGEKFHGFLIWWAITAFGAASYAREKVPWVGIHAAIPLIILMGSYAQKIWADKKWRRFAPALLALVAIAFAWNAKAAINLSFRNNWDVREKMVYGHTTDDLKHHCELVTRYQEVASVRTTRIGNGPEWISSYNEKIKEKDVKVLVKGATIWPVRWYLRDVDWTEWVDVNKAIEEKWPFIILDVDMQSKYPKLEQEYDIYRGRSRMFWTPKTLDWDRLDDIWKLWIPGHYLDQSPQAGPAYDAKQEWKKLFGYLLHRRTFERANSPWPDISSVDYVFCVRKDIGAF
ncbi:glycosyltransferase family 39 protein [bacterium]|nr:glycosyltransferase family 39 protein [bacterium]